MILRNLKRCVRMGIRRVTGRDIIPYISSFSPEARLIRVLNWMRVDTVVDVGAGHGEFCVGILENGFTGEVISIEPCQAAYNDLINVAQRHAKWTVTERCAAGREDGEAVLHVTRRSGSSSLRAPAPRHSQTDKESVEIGSEIVQVRRLDGLVGRIVPPGARLFLKIDVQGTEEDVLAGARGLMPLVVGMQIELSTLELYEGQKLMPEMLSWAACHGFELWSLSPVYVDDATGRVLQYDGVFCRGGELSADSRR